MVNGRHGEVWRWSAAVVVLVTACGGKSVSRGEDPGNDAGNGGTSSGRSGAGGAAKGGGSSNPPQSASGGASPGTGARSGSGGLAGNAGGPSLAMLDDLCENICTTAAGARCTGIELTECTTSCFSFAEVVENTAQCATAAYDYLACVNALTNICELDNDTICSDAEVIQCALEYCRQHPGAVECTSTAPQE